MTRRVFGSLFCLPWVPKKQQAVRGSQYWLLQAAPVSGAEWSAGTFIKSIEVPELESAVRWVRDSFGNAMLNWELTDYNVSPVRPKCRFSTEPKTLGGLAGFEVLGGRAVYGCWSTSEATAVLYALLPKSIVRVV